MSVRQASDQEPSSTPPSPGRGREAQRRRTRKALVEAARSLMAAGDPAPTVDAIAARADVSRRTVYVHFPTLDQLLLDAALGALSDAYVDTALETAATDLDVSYEDPGAEVRARVDALVTALVAMGDATMPLGRQIIRLTVDQAPSADDNGAPRPRRGSRRTAWIEAAIAPLADRLTPDQHQRLVAGLSLVIGFESMIVLRDVCGLDPASEALVNRWAAQALVDAILTEIGETLGLNQRRRG